MINETISRREMLVASAVLGTELIVSGPAAAAQSSTPTFATPTKKIPVAILLDRHAVVVDFAGPWEVFQDAEETGVPGFELFTVAPSREPLRVSGGMRIIPDYTLKDAPQANVIVIPALAGAYFGVNRSDGKVAWLKERLAHADLLLSVCLGSFLLAQTGCLDGLSATTHHKYYAEFEKRFPQVRLLRNQRFVEQGAIISTGGLTSGIDGALRVVERYYGTAVMAKTADHMEYVRGQWSVPGTASLSSDKTEISL